MLTAEQAQDLLRSRVGLRKGRDAGLLQDLRLSQIGGFRGQIGVTYTRFSGRQVGQLRRSEVVGIAELILSFTDDGLGATESSHSVGESRNRVLRAALR